LDKENFVAKGLGGAHGSRKHVQARRGRKPVGEERVEELGIVYARETWVKKGKGAHTVKVHRQVRRRHEQVEGREC
jgi:hypothetical protein